MVVTDVVDFWEFDALIDKIVPQISNPPDVVVCLSTGGFIVGATLAKRLGLKSQKLIGLPVIKDKDGFYRIDDAWLNLRERWDDLNVLVVDDFSNRGLLVRSIVKSFVDAGAKASGCVLIYNVHGIHPDIAGGKCEGSPPHGWWEVNDANV